MLIRTAHTQWTGKVPLPRTTEQQLWWSHKNLEHWRCSASVATLLENSSCCRKYFQPSYFYQTMEMQHQHAEEIHTNISNMSTQLNISTWQLSRGIDIDVRLIYVVLFCMKWVTHTVILILNVCVRIMCYVRPTSMSPRGRSGGGPRPRRSPAAARSGGRPRGCRGRSCPRRSPRSTSGWSPRGREPPPWLGRTVLGVTISHARYIVG